jgi:ribosome-binding factor A
MSGYRKERVADLLRMFIGEEIRRCRDPRLEMVSITGLELSKDLRHAKFFWSVASFSSDSVGPIEDTTVEQFLPEQSDVDQIQAALKGATGLFRKRIAQELDLRYVPDLSFYFDRTAITGSRIDYLLSKVSD